MVATIFREAPSYAAQFFTYEVLKRKLFAPGRLFGAPVNRRETKHSGNDEFNPELHGWRALICGGCAGFNAWLFSYGVDIAKTRIQANRPRFYKHVLYDGGLYHALKEIYVTEVGLPQ